MSNSKTGLFILCGEEVPHFSENAVVWSPIRRELIDRKTGCRYPLFGDFTPSPDVAESKDRQLKIYIERALLAEARSNSALRWAPLAVQQVQWRFLYRRWLKETFLNVLNTFSPLSVRFSSVKDRLFIETLSEQCRNRGISWQEGNGDFDDIGSPLYLHAPHDLPTMLDPIWLTKLRMFSQGRTPLLFQTYRNISGVFGKKALPYTFGRFISMGEAILHKIYVQFNGWSGVCMPINENHVSIKKHYPLTRLLWSDFPEDEFQWIQLWINKFFNHYTPEHIDLLAQRLEYVLKKLRPNNISLIIDKTPSARLLAYVGRRNDIGVDYLPHGLIFENDSPPKDDSPFYPERYMAWNQSSAGAYERLGYKSVAVAHPKFKRAVNPYRPLNVGWYDAKVLVLGADPVISIGSRQDCFLWDTIEIARALTSLGCRAKNIFVKEPNSNLFIQERISRHFNLWAADNNASFVKVNRRLDVMELMESFNLVIMYLTTGIYEAAFKGVPQVIFGPKVNLIGALEGIKLPWATNCNELQHVLKSYNNEAVDDAYRKLTESLSAGASLTAVYGI